MAQHGWSQSKAETGTSQRRQVFWNVYDQFSEAGTILPDLTNDVATKLFSQLNVHLDHLKEKA